jgi:hypothetical protein
MDYLTLTLPQLQAEADAVASTAETLFGSLTAAQLNWKPDVRQWSVGQCLDHLIQSSHLMHRPLDEVIAGTKRSRWLERVPGLAGLWGRIMVRAVAPQGKRRLRASVRATPSVSAIDPGVVRRFTALQRGTVDRMRRLASRDPEHVVITSPILGIVVYSALDACRVIVAHEHRHFAQAQRVMAAPGFPR